jgi:hypothetical protein
MNADKASLYLRASAFICGSFVTIGDMSYPPPPQQPQQQQPYGYPPPPFAYAIPAYAQRPGVWPWFVAYTIAMALMYFGFAAMGLMMLIGEPKQFTSGNDDPIETMVLGTGFTVVGVVLGVVFAIAPFLPRKPWVWVYDIVLICISFLMSLCLLPATIPLLIFWLKPETKHWFGRSA